MNRIYAHSGLPAAGILARRVTCQFVASMVVMPVVASSTTVSATGVSVTTAAALLVATMWALRSGGRSGSMGHQAIPRLAAAATVRRNSSLRSRCTATTWPGPNPRSRSTAIRSSTAAHTCAHVRHANVPRGPWPLLILLSYHMPNARTSMGVLVRLNSMSSGRLRAGSSCAVSFAAAISASSAVVATETPSKFPCSAIFRIRWANRFACRCTSSLRLLPRAMTMISRPPSGKDWNTSSQSLMGPTEIVVKRATADPN